MLGCAPARHVQTLSISLIQTDQNVCRLIGILVLTKTGMDGAISRMAVILVKLLRQEFVVLRLLHNAIFRFSQPVALSVMQFVKIATVQDHQNAPLARYCLDTG